MSKSNPSTPPRTTLAELAGVLSDQVPSLSHAAAVRALRAVLSHAGEALAQGRELALPELGALRPKLRAGRPGRNPRTGKALSIPPRRVVVFREGKALRDRLAEPDGPA